MQELVVLFLIKLLAMTRINIIPTSNLMDQDLIYEYKKINMVTAVIARESTNIRISSTIKYKGRYND